MDDSLLNRSAIAQHKAIPVIVLLSRFALAAVFAAAAWPKLIDAHAFAQSIENYQVVSGPVAGVLARILPSMEAVIALALLVGVYPRGAALLAVGLLLVFQVAIAQAMLRGIDLSCGCFGSKEIATISWRNLVRNAALITIGIPVVVFDRQKWSDLTALFKRDTIET